jgi:hypothetical protein
VTTSPASEDAPRRTRIESPVAGTKDRPLDPEQTLTGPQDRRSQVVKPDIAVVVGFSPDSPPAAVRHRAAMKSAPSLELNAANGLGTLGRTETCMPTVPMRAPTG